MIKGRIVLIPFPFDNLSGSKIRPTLCLTEKMGPYNQIVMAYITSQIVQPSLETDLILQQEDKEFEKTGLSVSSTIRFHRLITLPSSLIKRDLGILPPHFSHEAKKCIKKLFSLPS